MKELLLLHASTGSRLIGSVSQCRGHGVLALRSIESGTQAQIRELYNATLVSRQLQAVHLTPIDQIGEQ